MRPLRLFLTIGPAFALAVCTAGSGNAAGAARTITVLNAGTEAVYAVRLGHRGTEQWGADLLAPSDVIDIGAPARLRVTFSETCWYDVRLEYADGHVRELDDVNLCSVKRLTVDH